MRKGRYNVQLPTCYGSVIRKFNIYKNDFGRLFISFEGEYVQIEKKEPYKGGWLWQLKNYVEVEMVKYENIKKLSKQQRKELYGDLIFECIGNIELATQMMNDGLVSLGNPDDIQVITSYINDIQSKIEGVLGSGEQKQ